MVVLLKLLEKMKNNILIISHYFPPIPGVGGRRWTKFVKHLSRKEDQKIHVISAKNNFKNIQSSFEDELKTIDFKHTVLDSKYPKYLERVEFKKSTLKSKIMFRIQHYLIKKKIKGNYWDLSVFWQSHFDKTIPDIISSEKIEKIIISGPPYRYVEYACKLKDIFPNLQIILDYRDPWNDFNSPKKFEKTRHDFEINLERQSLKNVDKIITVSEFQKSLILKKEPNSAPIHIIPNGFDPDDYEMNSNEPKMNPMINITHFGTLHFQKDYYWIPFFNAYHRLKTCNPDIYENINLNLIGYCPKEILDYIKLKELNVITTGMIPPREAFKYLQNTDIALWFKYDGSPGDYATKFGDYIALKKFMWTFSVKGAVTEHIIENRIGKVFYRDDKDLENHIYDSFLKIENINDREFNYNYNSERLNISNLTEELIKVLDNPT